MCRLSWNLGASTFWNPHWITMQGTMSSKISHHSLFSGPPNTKYNCTVQMFRRYQCNLPAPPSPISKICSVCKNLGELPAPTFRPIFVTIPLSVWPSVFRWSKPVCAPQFENHWKPVMTCLLQLSALSTECPFRAAIWTFQPWWWSLFICTARGSCVDGCKGHL